MKKGLRIKNVHTIVISIAVTLFVMGCFGLSFIYTDTLSGLLTEDF
ncbi:MAG: hypothetical protein IPG29_16145 [Sphingobacteriales bacterium]|nr:hypothetical protein [Sphingobacteriales bacterium]